MTGQEKLKEWLLSLRDFSRHHEDWVILVEGKRDKVALERFGIENVEQMKSKPYHTVADELSKRYRGAVMLMDFDEKGEQIERKLSRILSMYGMSVDRSFRERLRETGVKFVEDILEKVKRRKP